MKLKIYFLSLVILLVTFSQQAQAQNKRRYYDAYVAEGDSCLAHQNYYGAHQTYLKALTYLHSTEVCFKIADACRNYQNYADAETYYRIALKEDSVSHPDAKYFYADMLKYQGKYKEAREQYYEYYRLNRKTRNYYTKRAKNEAKVCKSKVQLIRELDKLKIKRIDNDSINTMYSEYSPAQYNDSIFFFAGIRAQDEKLADSLYVFSNYFQRMSTAILRDSTYHNIKQVESLNTDGYHVGNLSFNKVGDVAYYSKCKDYNCAIYKSKYDYKTGEFSDEEKLPAIINAAGSTSTTPHLAVTKTGEILFFASNRKGTKGMLDIWYSFINEDGSFEKPRNPGKSVNSIGNEVTPFYNAADSLLYFSSEWHPSLGGYDIFSTKVNWATNVWSAPQNIGKPINSSYNDLYYTYSRDSLHAYWVSNRTESTKLIGKAFSNDIYTHPLVGRALDKIDDLVPIFLYFDNDYPDPRSRDTITDKEYHQLYQDFYAKKPEYIEQYTKRSPEERLVYDTQIMETFFEDMTSEYEKLIKFAELMEVILKDGQDIVVVFKGYASPVGNTEYNKIVAKKRVSCIQNFFYEFNDGKLNQYTTNEVGSGKGSLKYVLRAIGETKVDNTFIKSDGEEISALSNRKEKWMSVYSPAAAYQRKIEIEAVNVEYEDELIQKIDTEIESIEKTTEDDGTPIDDEDDEDIDIDGDQVPASPAEKTNSQQNIIDY